MQAPQVDFRLKAKPVHCHGCPAQIHLFRAVKETEKSECFVSPIGAKKLPVLYPTYTAEWLLGDNLTRSGVIVRTGKKHEFLLNDSWQKFASVITQHLSLANLGVFANLHEFGQKIGPHRGQGCSSCWAFSVRICSRRSTKLVREICSFRSTGVQKLISQSTLNYTDTMEHGLLGNLIAREVCHPLLLKNTDQFLLWVLWAPVFSENKARSKHKVGPRQVCQSLIWILQAWKKTSSLGSFLDRLKDYIFTWQLKFSGDAHNPSEWKIENQVQRKKMQDFHSAKFREHFLRPLKRISVRSKQS